MTKKNSDIMILEKWRKRDDEHSHYNLVFYSRIFMAAFAPAWNALLFSIPSMQRLLSNWERGMGLVLSSRYSFTSVRVTIDNLACWIPLDLDSIREHTEDKGSSWRERKAKNGERKLKMKTFQDIHVKYKIRRD